MKTSETCLQAATEEARFYLGQYETSRRNADQLVEGAHVKEMEYRQILADREGRLEKLNEVNTQLKGTVKTLK